MRIVADENIPYVREAFAGLGEVRTLPGRGIATSDIADADILLVRSITRVDAALLAGTPVSFVATATIGEDHIDKAYLAERGIGFSSAPGCNANSVGEYIVAALLVLAERHGFSLVGKTLGIVGVGNVGRRVHAKASALGMQCILHDPPRAAAEGAEGFAPREALYQCDVVTLHVPYTKVGPRATRHLVDAGFLARLRPDAILINTARGAVVDNQALDEALAVKRLRAAVLDVWEGEPNPRQSLLEQCDIATPHIAGYSFDGKVNGTEQIYRAACQHFGIAPNWDPAPLLPAPEMSEIELASGETGAIERAVTTVYDILADDARLRAITQLPGEARGAHFDRLRKEYPRRREFMNTLVRGAELDNASVLRGIGFRVAE